MNKIWLKILEAIKFFMRKDHWRGPTGPTGPTGIQGITGISYAELIKKM
jgi:hypothetical protein